MEKKTLTLGSKIKLTTLTLILQEMLKDENFEDYISHVVLILHIQQSMMKISKIYIAHIFIHSH